MGNGGAGAVCGGRLGASGTGGGLHGDGGAAVERGGGSGCGGDSVGAVRDGDRREGDYSLHGGHRAGHPALDSPAAALSAGGVAHQCRSDPTRDAAAGGAGPSHGGVDGRAAGVSCGHWSAGDSGVDHDRRFQYPRGGCAPAGRPDGRAPHQARSDRCQRPQRSICAARACGVGTVPRCAAPSCCRPGRPPL